MNILLIVGLPILFVTLVSILTDIDGFRFVMTFGHLIKGRRVKINFHKEIRTYLPNDRYPSYIDCYGEKGTVVFADGTCVQVELDKSHLGTISITKNTLMYKENGEPMLKTLRKKIKEEQPKLQIKKTKTKMKMPYLLRMAIYAAEVTLVWKFVNNSEQIVMFLVNHFIK